MKASIVFFALALLSGQMGTAQGDEGDLPKPGQQMGIGSGTSKDGPKPDNSNSGSMIRSSSSPSLNQSSSSHPAAGLPAGDVGGGSGTGCAPHYHYNPTQKKCVPESEKMPSKNTGH